MTTRYSSSMIFIDCLGFSGRDASGYEQSVKWHLDLIRCSQSGHALLRAIERTGKRLTIKPYKPSPEDPFNARAVTPGGNFEIWYSPTMWGFGGAAASVFPPANPGNGPSAILFHEMAHAYREMRGNFNARRTTQQGYENQEEFFAILISNIFVTDPSARVQLRTLRADHQGFTPLPMAQSTSQGFLEVAENRLLVAQFWGQEFSLMADLLNVNASFNPTREYYRLKFPNFSP
jgi:hypothetical protein